MSRSPYFFVERYNEKIKGYELQHPLVWDYNHERRVLADLYPYNGSHDLFSIVEGNSYPNFPDMTGIHIGVPEDSCKEIKRKYEACCFSDGKHELRPNARWFNYLDMYVYCLENPTAPDYDAMDEAAYYAGGNEKIETITKPTPLLSLKNRVDMFLEVMDDWWREDRSRVRIVYWFM